ncbi:MAG: TonB-dependent receptor, partial [Methylococcales bacterium]|nr:TonB-dependent receptor [Methylococcales bacterium]
MNRAQTFVSPFIKIFLLIFFDTTYAENIDPSQLSIEQLMESKVTSVSRVEQKFSNTAAAVYIVNQDDIQRSGVTTIPDALRMVPGIQVARIGSSQWAITARGFNGSFANKMLVLMDGRAIYSPTFAGVRWENHDLVLNDIERIEIIRGPGASVWGQNAVNGVINIMTKHTEETQEGLISVITGNEERAVVELRYGDQLGDKANYRVYGKFLHRDGLVNLQEESENDDWTQGRGGFRIDWNSNSGDRIMVEGDGYLGDTKSGFLLPADNPSGPARMNSLQHSGASILTRWEHDFSVASKTKMQFYYDYLNQTDDYTGDERRHTFDIDFQHDIAVSKNNYFNWGLGYRFISDSVFDSKITTVSPNHKNLHLVSAFIQDRSSFFDDTLHLTLGTKVQYYTLANWDFEPSVRLLWKFHPEHRIWAALSRSTRAPSRGETALNLKPQALPSQYPTTIVSHANPALEEEHVLSYEVGYRGWFGNQLSFDLALFYNDYENLITGLNQWDYVSPQVPVSLKNGASAQTWGFEIAADWRPTNALKLQLSYNFLQLNYHNFNFSNRQRPQTDPENQLSFRSSYDITSTITFGTWVRYVDSISAINTLFSPKRNVDSYISLDLRLAWKPIHNLELSLVGQNLNNKTHQEYVKEVFAYPQQVERSIYGKIQW